MANDRFMPRADSSSQAALSGVTRTEFDRLSAELRNLRHGHDVELADRLRDARAHGSPGDNEDLLTVYEEASVIEAQIARLETLLSSTPIVDQEFDGRVGLGCTVRVVHAGEGDQAEYTLVGRRSAASPRHEVSAGSPVGKALLGARPGQTVLVELPDGRSRELRILDVSPGSVGAEAAPFEPTPKRRDASGVTVLDREPGNRAGG